MRPRGASTARGGCPRRAAMVPTTTGVGGVGERRVTAVAAGSGGGGAAKSTSMGADADDPASNNGAGGDGDAVGSPHSTIGSGTTAVHPWRTQKCTFTAFRDLVHRWECSGLPNGECFQHRIINNMKNFAHTTYAHGNNMLHTLLLMCRPILLFLSRTTCSSSSPSLIFP
jgi:hypothetical protein